MKVKVFLKYIPSAIFFLIVFFVPTNIFAAEPSFSLYPKGGTVVNPGSGFVVDVLIDSAGESLTSAKFVILFDPAYLQLKKAERNNSLFSQYPQDESSIDNENGVVMLSGFTQSGADTLYATGEKADVFARLTFNVIQEGETELSWRYGSGDAIFDTVMYKEGSPPQNILLSEPESATYTMGEVILDPSNVNTGLPVVKYVWVTGVVLVLFGLFILLTWPRSFWQKKGMVVVYDEE